MCGVVFRFSGFPPPEAKIDENHRRSSSSWAHSRFHVHCYYYFLYVPSDVRTEQSGKDNNITIYPFDSGIKYYRNSMQVRPYRYVIL